MLQKAIVFTVLSVMSLSPIGATGPKTSLITMDSGLQYRDEKVGSGNSPKRGQIVIVKYTGTLPDGTTFDSTKGRAPLRFTYGEGQVIQGWEEGLATMKPGGQRTLVIPANLAYGTQGMEGVIPPDTTLHFDVELIGVEGKGTEGDKGTKS